MLANPDYINISIVNDLMVAYLINARLTTFARREGYERWGVYNIFLAPAHDWIHNCIRDWTWEWDPALNTSAVWPNLRQGIIAVLSGGTVGRFRKLIRAEEKGRKWKHLSGA